MIGLGNSLWVERMFIWHIVTSRQQHTDYTLTEKVTEENAMARPPRKRDQTRQFSKRKQPRNTHTVNNNEPFPREDTPPSIKVHKGCVELGLGVPKNGAPSRDCQT